MKFQLHLPTTSLALLALIFAAGLVGCHRRVDAGPGGGFAVVDSSDCLPPTALLDQHGQKVSLADLKGKPILFDFIYTSCPGECLTLTQRMKRIATALGPELGKQARLVSITVDPEHDQVGSSRVDLQACKLEYSIVSPK